MKYYQRRTHLFWNKCVLQGLRILENDLPCAVKQSRTTTTPKQMARSRTQTMSLPSCNQNGTSTQYMRSLTHTHMRARAHSHIIAIVQQQQQRKPSMPVTQMLGICKGNKTLFLSNGGYFAHFHCDWDESKRTEICYFRQGFGLKVSYCILKKNTKT